MQARVLFMLAAFVALAACSREAPSQASPSEGPQLEAPAPEAEPVRAFAPVNDAATGAFGVMTVSLTTRMPDASEANQGAAPRDVLTLTGANHLVLEAQSYSAVSPGVQVQGQTIRALMALPVETSQVVVYKVTSETKPESGQGVCGSDSPAYIVEWEPEVPGDASLKLMGVAGAAPGASGAHACPMLEYHRQ